MVFYHEGQFQQFPHCKFRENIVRLLYIPHLVEPPEESPARKAPSQSSHLFVAVNKFGKVGLYHPENFCLVHTYCLDLSIRAPTSSSSRSSSSSSHHRPVTPKCERTHLVTDAVFSSDTLCIIFATTKCLLQWYDIGEIQRQDIGLSLFPRKEFLSLYENSFPVTHIPNKGHVESHRLLGLPFIPTCLEYYGRRLIIGDTDGGVTLITISNAKRPLGRRKVRGRLHKIQLSELPHGVVQYYKAHPQPLTDIHLIPERHLILTSSRDKKFSVYVKDLSSTPMDSIIVSLPKGVNSLTYSAELKMVATGSDDFVVRLFNQFVMKMPQMEMLGHRAPLISVNFVQVDFFVVGAEQGEKPILLLSFSADCELRAWDPLTFVCLQSLYLSFPVGSTILCKTPEFATKSLLVFRPQQSGETITDPKFRKSRPHSNASGSSSNVDKRVDYGTIVLLYCNSYARISLEKENSSRWPGVDYDKFIREFEELSLEYDRKLRDKLSTKPTVTSGGGGGRPSVRSHVAPAVIPEELDEKEEEEAEKEDDVFGEEATAASVCPRLSKDELSEIDKRVEQYLQEILELRQAMRGDRRPSVSLTPGNTGRLSESTFEEEEEDEEDRESSPVNLLKDPLAISVQATNTYFEFRRTKSSRFQGLPKSVQRMLSYGHAFNQYPILELEPVQFSRGNLVIPEKMRRELGIESVSSVQDLMTPEAKRYFGSELAKRQKRNKSGGGSVCFTQQNEKLSSSAQDCGNQEKPNASRFTIFGQKIRSVYEADCLSPTHEASEEDDDHDQLVHSSQHVVEFH